MSQLQEKILRAKEDLDAVYEAGANSCPPDYLPIATTVKFDDWNIFGKSNVVFNIPLVSNYAEAFYSEVPNNTVEHLTINGAYDGKIIDVEYAFGASSNFTEETLKHVTLNCDFSKCKYFSAMFVRRKGLETIDGTPIDFSGAENIGSFVGSCASLVTLRVKEGSVKVDLNLKSCGNLSNETKQSIFDGLATVTTTKTLTLHSALKILQSQVDTANAKGWTISGGTIVSEEEYYG